MFIYEMNEQDYSPPQKSYHLFKVIFGIIGSIIDYPFDKLLNFLIKNDINKNKSVLY